MESFQISKDFFKYKMMYVAKFIIDQKPQIEEGLEEIDEIQQEHALNYMILIIIDYTYHHDEEDYDGGLSFLDRLNEKLGEYHPDWNIDDFKNTIRNAKCPELQYLKTIEMMLEKEEDRFYYGI